MKKYQSSKMTVKQYSYVLSLTVKKNIKQQYRNSFLGVIWTVLNPLLNMLVMWFVFDTIFGANGASGMDYACYLLAGNIVFTLMRESTTTSLTCIVENRDLMTKTRVPVSIFPLARVMTALSNFGFSLLALLGVMLVQCLRGKLVIFNWTMLLSLLMLPALILFSLGVGYILATLYVKFRDIKHLYTVFVTLWTYITPIFYTLDRLDKAPVAQTVVSINPMYYFVTYFREVFVAGQVSSWMNLLICYAWGIGMFVIGTAVLAWKKKNFVVNL